MPNEDFDALLASLKKAAAALRDAEVPFVLGGGLACWARGGSESDHDLDLMVRPEDADRALEVLSGIGMKPEKPPEGWLYKAYDENDVMIDLIFEPTGLPSRRWCWSARRSSRSLPYACGSWRSRT